MTNPDPHADEREAARLLSVFSERPTEVLGAAQAVERRERAISHIRAILQEPAPSGLSLVGRSLRQNLPTRMPQIAAGLALAAGLAFILRNHYATSSEVMPAASLRLIESSGNIECSPAPGSLPGTDQGSGFRACDPARESTPRGLRTLAGAHLTVETQIGVRLALSSESTLMLTDSSPAPGRSQVLLTSGTVDVTVPQLGPQRQFQVMTPSATVTVHGTAFTVAVTDVTPASASQDSASQAGASSKSTCVTLREGVITVEGEGRVDTLVAPATWGCRAATSGSQPESPAGATGSETRSDKEPSNAQPTDRAATSASKVDSGKVHSTLALETRLLQTALQAERRGNPVQAENHLKLLLSTYPNSVVAPDARAALERIARRRDQAR